jgi:glycosyltransferase involved in cell wall biosynthesis
MSRFMPKRRVLVNAMSAGFGGGRSYIVNFLREVGRDDRGFDFTVLALRGSLDGLDLCGVPMEEVTLPSVPGPLRTPLRVLWEQTALPWRSRRHDLLYCLADVAPLLPSAPIVLLMRNLNIYDRRWDDTSRTRTLARLSRASAGRARRIVFPSQAAADQIAAVVPIPAGRGRVVPYGVDAETLAGGALPSVAEAGDERPYVFLPAAPERHKNLGVIVRALARLGPPLELRVAGSSTLHPEHKDEILALAGSLGVADRVHFLGAVPYDALLSLYRGSRALVFPSYHETFGHPILEAMATRTPIVASDIATFRELASDVALFFPPDDAEALADRLTELEQRVEEREQRLRLGGERAKGYSWRRSIDGLCQVFEEALAEGTR